MELRLLIRARWCWSINTLGGKIPYVRTHTIFPMSSPYYDNLIPSIVLLPIPMCKLKHLKHIHNVIFPKMTLRRKKIEKCQDTHHQHVSGLRTESEVSN
jgi:hypothetical protein